MKGGGLFLRVALFLLVALVAVGARAQMVTSDMSGTVRDQSAAVVPGAKVTLVNAKTTLSLSTESDKDGLYRIHGLPPGSYELHVEAQGFESFTRKDITVDVNQQLAEDVELVIGSSSQTVSVTADTVQVETTTAQVSSLVTEQTLNQLPLNGRDLFGLTLLQPGVVPTTNAGNNPWAIGTVDKAASQGTRLTMFNITSDGSDINDPGFNIPPGGPAGVELGVEATEEYRVVLNPYDAEYGRNAGANVQYVTKQGTNAYHGTVYEFVRNSAFDARNYFDPAVIPLFVRNQFGASLGGPIKKDKLFFFADYESLRERRGVTDANVLVPTAATIAGYLPTTTNGCHGASAASSTCVFVGVNPNAAKLLALFPQPNGADRGNGVATWTGAQKEPAIDNYGTARVDYNFTPKDQFFVRYTVDSGLLTEPGGSLTAFVPGFQLTAPSLDYYSQISWQHEFSNSFFNQAKFNFNRTAYISDPASAHGVSTSLDTSDPYLGSISTSGALSSLGYSLIQPLGTKSNVVEIIDNASWDKGKHSFKFGADVKRIQVNGPYSYGYQGSYTFSSAGLPATAPTTNNAALEALLLGDPATYTGANPAFNSDRYFRQNYLGFYAQDDFKLSSRLTLNLGVRWEYWGQIGEKYNRTGNIANLYTAPALELTTNQVWQHIPLDLWSPRVGFAWQPFGSKTSIRGGYGIMRDQFYENIYGDIRLYLPYYQIVQFNCQSTGVNCPKFLLPPTSLNATGGVGTTIGSYGMTSTPKWPYYHEYSFDVERQLSSDMLLRVGYAGSEGIHLLRTGEANPTCELLVDQPASLCTAANLGQRLNPNFGSTPLVVTDATSNFNALEVSLQKRMSKGLMVQASYTWSHEIDTASSPYPSDYGSSPDVTQNYFNLEGDKGPGNTDRRNVFVTNYIYNLPFGSGEKFGANTNGVASRLISGWQWTGILSLESGPPYTVTISNFNNSGIGIGSTSGDRPNVTPGANECANTGLAKQWFTTSIYSLPTVNTFGDAGRNAGCGPGLHNLDMGLVKFTKITEATSLEFRAEAFNIFNITNLQTPTAAAFTSRQAGCTPASSPTACGVVNSAAGLISATTTTSRQIQFALKLNF